MSDKKQLTLRTILKAKILGFHIKLDESAKEWTVCPLGVTPEQGEHRFDTIEDVDSFLKIHPDYPHVND